MSSNLFKAAVLVLTAVATVSATSALAGDYRHWRHHDRSGLVRLPQLAPSLGFKQQQPAKIVLMDRHEAASTGTYAGTADVYRANGGTYVVGYNDYDPYARPAAPQPRPRAKVINVRHAPDPCSHEAGVCVIRP